MSAIAVALKHMLAAGMPHDAIVAAVAEMEAAVTPVRSKGAERQERYRRNKASQNVTCDAPLSLPPNENNSNPPTHTRDNIPTRVKGRSKPEPIAKPDDVSVKTWADFLIHRKAKGAPVTETAMSGIRREAEKAGWSMEAALIETMARGWQGFRADWVASTPPVHAAAAPGSFLASLGSGP